MVDDPVKPFGNGPEPTRGRVTIFVSDPSAEAEQVAAQLKALGYVVVDVPLAMLVARVAVQRPRIVIVDADADGAYGSVFRMRELPESDSIDVLFLGRSNEPATDSVEDAGSFFPRPVDMAMLVRRIETLTSEDVSLHAIAPPARPSILPGPGLLPSPSMRIERPSVPPPPSRARVSQPPPSVGFSARRAAGGALSNELLDLLADAEERAQARVGHDSNAPSPEDEIEAVLPTELLAALDEPLEEPELEEDESDRGRHTTSSGGRKVTTGADSRADIEAPREVTSSERIDKTHSPTVPPPKSRDVAPSTPARESHDSAAPPATTSSPSLLGGLAGETLAHVLGQVAPPSSKPLTDVPSERQRTSPGASSGPTSLVSIQPGAASLPPFANATTITTDSNAIDVARVTVSLPPASGSMAVASVPPPVGAEAVLGPGGALETVARAIVTRVSGSLSFEAQGGLRRVILREGDIVTCASSLADESLLSFLQGRGDFPPERAEALAGRVPAFGRHAGAALVAHGVLRQDQLWPVLRSHAEWILGRTLAIPQGVFVREAEAPGRLKGEPSVFGGSTGAEVIVDVVRRVIDADDAVGRLGGAGATMASGPNEALLVECALDERENHIVKTGIGRRVEEILASFGSDAAPLLYALSLVGVLDSVRAITSRQALSAVSGPTDPFDEEAVVAKIEARLALVDEGDYFAILGVPRTATGYEIRRAFLDLRRTFEPARLLTPKLSHLASDVGKISIVLEEAFDILRDDVRRERYRRAIEARPME